MLKENKEVKQKLSSSTLDLKALRQVLTITYQQETQAINAVTTTKGRLSKFSQYFESSITKTCLL